MNPLQLIRFFKNFNIVVFNIIITIYLNNRIGGSKVELNQKFQKTFEREILPIIREIIPKKNFQSFYYALKIDRKRFRSTLPLITSKISKFDYRKAKMIGAISEITWAAIIMHDDIIDKDSKRKGRDSTHVEFGINETLSSGIICILDCFLALRNNMEDKVNSYAETVKKTYYGQKEHQNITEKSDLEELLNLYAKKTSLGVWCISTPLSDSSIKKKIKKFQRNLGIAGQIKNDLNDFFFENNYQNRMRDLEKGIINLPLFLLLHKSNKKDKKQIKSYLGAKKSDIDELAVNDFLRR